MANNYEADISLNTQVAVNQLQLLNDRLGDTSDGARTATQSLAAVGQGIQNAAGRIQSAAGAVAQLASQFGSDNETASLVGRLAHGAATIGGTTAQFAAMGAMLGPHGAIIGGIIGLGTSLISLISAAEDTTEASSDTSRAIENIGTEARESTTLVDRLTEALRAQAAAAEDAGNERLLESWYQGVFRNLEDARNAITFFNNEIEALGEPTTEIMEGRLADLQRALDAARRAEEAFIRNPPRPPRPAERGRRGTSEDEDAELERRLEVIREHDEAIIELEKEKQEALIELEREAAEEANRIFQERFDRNLEILQNYLNEVAARNDLIKQNFESADDTVHDIADSWGADISTLADAIDDYNIAAEKMGIQTISTTDAMGQAFVETAEVATEQFGMGITNAFAQSVSAAIQGAEAFDVVMKKMVIGVLDSLLQQSIVQVVTEIALAISDFAKPFGVGAASGAMHLAAAGAWGAVGVAAGGGLAALSAGGGGAPSPSTPAPIAPPASAPSEEGGGGNVINVYYSNPLFQTEEEMIRMFESLQRRVGR